MNLNILKIIILLLELKSKLLHMIQNRTRDPVFAQVTLFYTEKNTIARLNSLAVQDALLSSCL